MDKYSSEAISAIVNGCSGGLSWAYNRLLGKDISCRYCCDEHDLAYHEGGSEADRKLADKRLRDCAARAGNFEGWRGPLRRGWRWLRAWAMYAAVRVFGGRYWQRNDLDKIK